MIADRHLILPQLLAVLRRFSFATPKLSARHGVAPSSRMLVNLSEFL